MPVAHELLQFVTPVNVPVKVAVGKVARMTSDPPFSIVGKA